MYPIPTFHLRAIIAIMWLCLAFVFCDAFVFNDPDPKPADSLMLSPYHIQTVEVCTLEQLLQQYREIAERQERKIAEAAARRRDYELSRRFDDKTFRVDFERTQPIETLRQAVYDNPQVGEIKIRTHKGGKALDYSDMRDTVRYVVSSMPNVDYSVELIDLVLETCMTETHFGIANYDTAVKNYANYGLVQIRKDTAEDTLKWLGWVRKDVKNRVMAFYDSSLTLEENLLYNVPFSIAMCVQIYWRKIPDLSANVNTLTKRAMMWKSVYNSSLGEGTVNAYLKRQQDLLALL